MINPKFALIFMFISSVVMPVTSIAAEDFVLTAPDLHTRTLAATCATCHGTNGNAVKSHGLSNASLAGIDASYFKVQMLAFRNGDRPATVMHRYAKGLQMDEINQLAAYFSAQKKLPAISPNPQTLKASHD